MDETRRAMRRIMLNEARLRRRSRDEPEQEPEHWVTALSQDPAAFVASIPDMFRVSEVADKMRGLAVSVALHVRLDVYDGGPISPKAFGAAGLLRKLFYGIVKAGLKDEVFSQDEVRREVLDMKQEVSTIQDVPDHRSMEQFLLPIFNFVEYGIDQPPP